MAASHEAEATVVVGTSVIGEPVYAQWEDPAFIGTVLDGGTGNVYPPGTINTTSTAVYDLGSATPAASTTITWGANPNPAAGVPPDSSITFTGNPSIPADKGTVDFPIGSFSYTNGTSVYGTGIFGATLVLYAVGIDGNVPIGSVDFRFTSTLNDGTDAQNADYLNVEGISTSFNVLEGASTSASLYGTIVGDPIFVPSYFQLDPGQTGGFVGNSLPSPVPEPSTWAMMLLGFSGLGFVGLRRMRKMSIPPGVR